MRRYSLVEALGLKKLSEQKQATVDKAFAAKAEKTMPDVSSGPATMKAFLNGPGKDARVRAVLDAGLLDGSEADEQAAPKETSKVVGDLMPTQQDIDLTKSIAYPLSKIESLKMMIANAGSVQRLGPPGNDTIVCSGNIIVDGHHRWSSCFAVTGPSGQIAAYDLALPEKDAASILAATQVGIAATLRSGQEVPSAEVKPGTNILGKNEAQIISLIEGFAGKKILSPDFLKVASTEPTVLAWAGVKEGSSTDEVKEAIIKKVASNLSQMKQPAPGSPERPDMPQLDQAAGGVRAVINKLGKGKVNYKKPLAPAAGAEGKGEVSDGVVRRDLAIMERWQKLAGILKD